MFLDDLGGVLVVDDEPTESPQRGLHFLVRAGDKRLRALPVVLSREAAAYTWDDIEGVARDSTHLYWIA